MKTPLQLVTVICAWNFVCQDFVIHLDATCYKNPENSGSIDLILTNNPLSFQYSCVIETGLSDFHRMVVTVMETSFERL